MFAGLPQVGQIELALRGDNHERVSAGMRQSDLAAEDVDVREDVRNRVDVAAEKPAGPLLVRPGVELLHGLIEARFSGRQFEQPIAQRVGHHATHGQSIAGVILRRRDLQPLERSRNTGPFTRFGRLPREDFGHVTSDPFIRITDVATLLRPM